MAGLRPYGNASILSTREAGKTHASAYGVYVINIVSRLTPR